MKTKTAVQRFLLSAVLGLAALGGGNAAQAQIITPLATDADSFASPVGMRSHPNAVQLQGLEYVVPELIIGGEWTSTIRLTNRGTQPVPTTNVYFVDNTGNPMQTTFQITNGSVITDVGFSFSLAVGGMVEATFLGGSSATFGQAIIGCSSAGCGTPGIYGEVTLRNHNATRPDFASVFPLERPFALQYMLFDGRNGLTTTMYLVNENTSASQVAIDIVDSNNTILGTVNLTFPGLSSQIFTLHVLAPETIGIQGTLVIHGQNSSGFLMTATALRIDPSNSFTPVRAFVPAR
jgi:hypothetical protein